MSDLKKSSLDQLREATPARVGLGNVDGAIPTQAQLAFQFAHARARDAVWGQVDFAALQEDIEDHPVIAVKSAAPDRATYLRRPDLGRRLSAESQAHLKTEEDIEILFVIADGLSSNAVMEQAIPVLKDAMALLKGFKIGPVIFAEQARVAIGDEIGKIMGAQMVILLIGERPGLTVSDSLGAYLTFGPNIQRKDSERNCISNIHSNGGLSPQIAAQKIEWITREAMRLKLTGTGLKEDFQSSVIDASLMAEVAHDPDL